MMTHCDKPWSAERILRRTESYPSISLGLLKISITRGLGPFQYHALTRPESLGTIRPPQPLSTSSNVNGFVPKSESGLKGEKELIELDWKFEAVEGRQITDVSMSHLDDFDKLKTYDGHGDTEARLISSCFDPSLCPSQNSMTSNASFASRPTPRDQSRILDLCTKFPTWLPTATQP